MHDNHKQYIVGLGHLDPGMHSITVFDLSEGKKNKITVSFNAAEPSGKTYKFRFTVFYTGRVDLSTSATALDPMRYSGTIGQSSELDKEGK